jgi:hypothetical protein
VKLAIHSPPRIPLVFFERDHTGSLVAPEQIFRISSPAASAGRYSFLIIRPPSRRASDGSQQEVDT